MTAPSPAFQERGAGEAQFPEGHLAVTVFCEAKLGAHQALRVSEGMNLSRGRGGNETNAHCVPTESSIRQ